MKNKIPFRPTPEAHHRLARRYQANAARLVGEIEALLVPEGFQAQVPDESHVGAGKGLSYPILYAKRERERGPRDDGDREDRIVCFVCPPARHTQLRLSFSLALSGDFVRKRRGARSKTSSEHLQFSCVGHRYKDLIRLHAE